MFSPRDFDRIRQETFVDVIDYHAQIDSTNTRALQLVASDDTAQPCTLVLAEEQTAGRGRGNNVWWSGPGALTFSVLIDCQQVSLPIGRWPQIALTTGLAVCDGVDQFLGQQVAALKWPNDVFLEGKKVCGILVESGDHRRQNVVVGIGVNVNNSLASAPVELSGKAIALCDLLPHPIVPVDFLVFLLKRIASRLAVLASGDLHLPNEWQARCLLTNRKVEIDTGAQTVTGVCQGINHDGALLVQTKLACERILSGVVTKFE